jgi:hypothetical protein
MEAMDGREFLDAITRFDEFGARSALIEEGGVTYLENEFWTSGQRRGHPLHEVSYRACFKPQMPDFFISRLTEPGDTVLDPFMGRGTTPLQAALTSRRPAGNDINPIAPMLVGPRLNPPQTEAIAARLAAMPLSCGGSGPADLLAFYHPETLSEICCLRAWLIERESEGSLDDVDAWIRMVAINRLTGHSSGFLSGYTLPPNQAVSSVSQLRINERLGLTPPRRDLAGVILRKSRSLLRGGRPPDHPSSSLSVGPASRMPSLADASVALAVTSPPFLDVVDYAADNWLRIWFAGVDASAVPISMHRNVEDWSEMVREALSELARVVRPGGFVAFEVGEVRGGRVMLDRHVWSAAEGLPFDRLAVMVNRQEFSKTANVWGVSNGTKGTNSNRIVVLRRL